MASINYRLRNKDSIFITFSISRGNVFEKKLPLKVDAKDWSKSKKKAKPTNPELKNINTKLTKLKDAILTDYNEAIINDTLINSEWLTNRIDIFFGVVTETGISDIVIDVIQDLIDNAPIRLNSHKELGLSKSRVNSFKQLKRIFTEWNGNKRTRIKDVNPILANSFLKWMIVDKAYSKNYASKKIADLKTVCNYADENGILVSKHLSKIKIGNGERTVIVYLSLAELDKIANTHIVSEALQNARKWLLLGCNIGQRGSDLLNLTDSNFVDRNGLQVIELKQQKTGSNVTIPILHTTKEIIKDGLPYKISIQKFNHHIKAICKLADITSMVKGSKFDKATKRKVIKNYPKCDLITSHICRRSFATNNYGILPTPLIMQITAHKTEKVFLQYIAKDSLDYAQQIADFYELQKLKTQKVAKLSVIRNEKQSV